MDNKMEYGLLFSIVSLCLQCITGITWLNNLYSYYKNFYISAPKELDQNKQWHSAMMCPPAERPTNQCIS